MKKTGNEQQQTDSGSCVLSVWRTCLLPAGMLLAGAQAYGALVGFNAEVSKDGTNAVYASLRNGIADVRSDANALGGKYLQINENGGENGYPGSDARVATYTIKFPSAGTYDLYARLYYPEASQKKWTYAKALGLNNPRTSGPWRSVEFSPAAYGTYFWVNLTAIYGPGTPYDDPAFAVSSDNLTTNFQIGVNNATGARIDALAFGTTGSSFSDAQLDAAVNNLSYGRAAATGGIAYDKGGGYWVHVFGNSGTFTVNQNIYQLEYLVVGGGGGGGGGASDPESTGGGGGAGGLLSNSGGTLLTARAGDALSVTVGVGGAGGYQGKGGTGGVSRLLKTVGSPSLDVVANGGGYGSGPRSGGLPGGPGGSGGGGGGYSGGGTATGGDASPSGQGNAGGAGMTSTAWASQHAGSGGGCSAVGGTAGGGGGAGTNFTQFAGMLPDIAGNDGYDGWFAGGGGGASGSSYATPLAGGDGGGGAGGYSNLTATLIGKLGVQYTGGGGGGSSTDCDAGSGGCGVVIIKYKIRPLGTVFVFR